MRNGTAYQLQPLVRLTDATGSGSWPTPTSDDSKHVTRAGGDYQSLTRAVMWPTPRAGETTQGEEAARAYAEAGFRQPAVRNGKARSSGTFDTTLTTAVLAQQMYPTPTTRDWKDGSASSCANVPANGLLGRVVHQRPYPTPTANRRNGLQSHGVNVVTGSLNPTWVEWLMGYPLGWTVCMPSATPLSRKSPKSSGGQS